MRLLITSDWHVGHRVGLTPTEYNPKTALDMKGYDVRSWIWDWFQERIARLRPFEVHVNNGDAVDGPGEKTGGTEEITTNCEAQAEIVAAIMGFVGAPRKYIIYGTGYHTGNAEDWESVAAVRAGAQADTILNLQPEGTNTVFNFKHHVGGSQTPMGRHSPLSREHLWNLLWNEHGEYPKANVIVRSHVHYYDYAGGFNWLAMTTPALQGYGSKFARRLSGIVDIGFVYFDIDPDGGYTWKAEIIKRPYKAPVLIAFPLAEASITQKRPIGSLRRALKSLTKAKE